MLQVISHRYLLPVAMLWCLAAPALFSQSTVTHWSGNDPDWYSALNWSSGVPDETTDIIISVGSPSYADPLVPPPLAGDTARTMNLTVQSGGALRFTSAGVLVVHGKGRSTNDGMIVLGSGMILFKASVKFLNGSTFDASNGTIRFSGGTWESGPGSVFMEGTSTVVFEGNDDVTIKTPGGSSITFYDLEIASGTNVTLNGSVTVQHHMLINEGASVHVGAGSSLLVHGTCTNDGTVEGEGSISGVPGVLPVELDAFDARLLGDDVVLVWSTITETDNAGWQVERLVPEPDNTGSYASGDWLALDFVPGSGTSTTPQQYTYEDKNAPRGPLRYRLLQRDRSGPSEYSPVVEVFHGRGGSEPVMSNAYPNPFNPSTTLSYRIASSGRIRITVLDALGRDIERLADEDKPEGTHQVTWQGAGEASGIYFLRLEFDDAAHQRWSRTHRIVLLR